MSLYSGGSLCTRALSLYRGGLTRGSTSEVHIGTSAFEGSSSWGQAWGTFGVNVEEEAGQLSRSSPKYGLLTP
eukprot:3697800-Amphidinium_carterae.1